MSYSISVRAPSKGVAIIELQAKLHEIVVAQPKHAFDTPLSLEYLTRLLANIRDPADGEEYEIQVSCGLGWDADDRFNSVASTCQIFIAAKLNG